MSEIYAFVAFPRLPEEDQATLFRPLLNAQKRLSVYLTDTPFASACGAEGAAQLADALLSFWVAARAAVRRINDDTTAERNRLNDMAFLHTHVAHPQADAAEEVFQAAAGYSGAEGSRRERLDATVRQLRGTFGRWGWYGAASPEARWVACQRIIPEYTAALLAALDPDGRAAEDDDDPQTPSVRIIINHDSNTITIDGESYPGIDPDGLAVFEALWRLKLDGEVRAISADKLRRKLPNCNHVKTLERWLDALPKPIRNCIKGKPGAGRWLELPPPA